MRSHHARIGTWAAAAAVLAASLAGCGRREQTAGGAAASGNAAERQAAADASAVTSIPGYTPETSMAGNAASGNTSP